MAILAFLSGLALAGRLARTRTARGPSARFRPAFALAGAGLADVPGAAAQFVVRHTHSAVEIVLHMRLVVNCSSGLVLLKSAIQIKNGVDRISAHGAERNGVAREHDAVRLRTIVAARLVVGALERADFSGERAAVQQRRVAALFLTKQRIHFSFRPVRRAN